MRRRCWHTLSRKENRLNRNLRKLESIWSVEDVRSDAYQFEWLWHRPNFDHSMTKEQVLIVLWLWLYSERVKTDQEKENNESGVAVIWGLVIVGMVSGFWKKNIMIHQSWSTVEELNLLWGFESFEWIFQGNRFWVFRLIPLDRLIAFDPTASPSTKYELTDPNKLVSCGSSYLFDHHIYSLHINHVVWSKVWIDSICKMSSHVG